MKDADDAHYLRVSKIATLGWGLFACVVSMYAANQGSLIEVVNRYGSFFYGSILGVFILAILTKRATATGAFWGLVAGMVVVLTVAFTTPIAFLWHNLIGAVVVVVVGLADQPGRSATAVTADGTFVRSALSLRKISEHRLVRRDCFVARVFPANTLRQTSWRDRHDRTVPCSIERVMSNRSTGIRSARGFSILEMMFVVALMGILSTMAMLEIAAARRPALRGDGAMRVLLGQMRTARELAITQRRFMRVTLTDTNQIEVMREEVPGPATTVLSTVVAGRRHCSTRS